MIEMLERVLMIAVNSIDWTALVWTAAVALLYFLKTYVLDGNARKWMDMAIESMMWADKKGDGLSSEEKLAMSIDKFREIMLEETGKALKASKERKAKKLIHRALQAHKAGTTPKP